MKTILFGLAIVLGCAASEITCLAQGPQPPALPPAPVVVARIVEREVATGQSFVGTVIPSKKATIGSATDGRVVEFPLNEGDRVEEGQTLAKLLTETIKLQLQAAEAELNLRKEQLAELENGTRPEEIEQARVRMVGAEAKKKYTASRRARAEALFNRDRSTSEEERDEAVSAAIEAEQAYLDAKVAYELAVDGPRKEKIAQAHAQVAMQQATVEQLNDQILKHNIISRFNGYVTAEHTEIGQWVKKGDPVAEVAALDEVDVVAFVVEKHVPHIQVGMDLWVEVPALANRLFPGKVVHIVPQADVRARTFPVKVRVDNEITEHGPLLKSGMYARLTLPTGARQSALLVPKDALVLGGPQPLVYVFESISPNGRQGTVRPAPVVLGVAEGQLIQVTGPLESGQKVVVFGNERLRPAQEVVVNRIIEPEIPTDDAQPQAAALQ